MSEQQQQESGGQFFVSGDDRKFAKVRDWFGQLVLVRGITHHPERIPAQKREG